MEDRLGRLEFWFGRNLIMPHDWDCEEAFWTRSCSYVVLMSVVETKLRFFTFSRCWTLDRGAKYLMNQEYISSHLSYDPVDQNPVSCQRVSEGRTFEEI